MNRWLPVLVLPLAALLGHFMLLAVGFELLHADFASSVEQARQFRQGSWSAFTLNMSYGGVWLTALRAAWASSLPGHLSFSFIVEPALLALAAFFLVNAYCGRFAAWVTGLTVALGYQYLVGQYGNDIYVGYLILGCLILGVRAYARNPLLDLPPLGLFGASALCGLAIYTSRASLFYVIPFFLPASWLTAFGYRLGSPKGPVERMLIAAAAIFFGLFVYLELFGPSLGTVFARPLKLHATPNATVALFLLGLFTVKAFGARIRRPHLVRAGIALGGGLLGLLPEIWHFAAAHQLPPEGTGKSVSFSMSMAAIGSLPSAWDTIFGAGGSAGRNASILLHVLGLTALIRAARRDTKFFPVWFSAAFATFAYCRYQTYTFMAPRYLLPILPAILVGMGCLWQGLRAQGRVWTVAATALLALHLFHHLDARRTQVAELAAGLRLKAAGEIISRFQGQKIEWVAGDEYWQHSHSLTSLAEGALKFEPPATAPVIRDPRAATQAALAERVGIMLKSGSDSANLKKTEAFGREWNLTFLGTADGSALYLGTRL